MGLSHDDTGPNQPGLEAPRCKQKLSGDRRSPGRIGQASAADAAPGKEAGQEA